MVHIPGGKMQPTGSTSEGAQVLDLLEKDVKSAVINTLKEWKSSHS